MTDAFGFNILNRDGAARRGELTTAHGVVQTPAFMPVGTRGAVKAVTKRDLDDLGAEIILGNTYHLYLRPGDGLIARCGGLHRFMAGIGRSSPTAAATRSSACRQIRKIREEGAEFRSHLDGSLHLLTPEKAVDIQPQLGSDIAMVLDECVASDRPASAAGADPASGPDGVRNAMERSVRWARRGRERQLQLARRPRSPCLASSSPTRGRRSSGSSRAAPRPRSGPKASKQTVEIGFEAYAIGGLSVGEPVDVMYEVVAHTAPLLPEDRPRYLMGTGMPDDLIECVASGIDMFDCVLPTRNARNGQLLTRHGVARHQERAVRRGPPAARSGVRLLHLPQLFTRLPAPPFRRRRDDGRDPQLVA